MRSESEQLLSGYPQKEKAAYLGALASLATADRHADEKELEHFREIATAADIDGRPSSGGLGGMFGNNSMGMGRPAGPGGGMGGLGGSLGSLISGMARGRNNQSIGGMLGRLLK